MKKDEVYAGFKVIDRTDIKDLNATGIWLRHEKTGMEAYHLLNGDDENLFAFAFKTPPSDSTGVAHILEHSVLCGSRNYPLKDPFLQLSNQSVKTFLNAMTFPDKTLYPASTLVEADYFNLMSVYGDAVFFPLLEEWVFSQEAYRLEPGEDGKLTLQGVVYNEMKGNYSSAESIAGEWATRSLLPKTVYDHDSGGNPANIPELTYEQFKRFHADYYHPSNCRLFLCGNIDTKKQLDFISERFLQYFDAPTHTLPVKIERVKPFAAPLTLSVKAPASPDEADKGSSVQLNWLLGDATDSVTSMEAVFLSEVLLGHDGSPLNHALLESGLGEDIAPATGLESELLQLCFTVSLRGIKEKDVNNFETLVFSVLRNLCEKGIAEQEIEAACMSIDFTNREIRRASGPFSLVLMRRSLRTWLHGGRPDTLLFSRKTFEIIRERAKDPAYVPNLIKRLLLDNTHRSLVTVSPDPEYDSRFAEWEQEHIQALSSLPGFDHDKLRSRCDALLERQRMPDSPQLCALIPHLNPSDFSDDTNRIYTEKVDICGIRTFLHPEPTNGIVYIELALPVDVLEPDDFPYLPLFSGMYGSAGFGGMDWVQASAHTARIAGGFGASLGTFSSVSDEPDNALTPIQGRSWLFFHMKMLEEKTAECVEMLFSCLRTADFSDGKRLKDLLFEQRNQMDSSLVPAGHQYALMRSAYRFSRSKAIEEIWSGVSQAFTLRRMADMPVSELSARFERIRKTLLSSGMIMNITAENPGIEKTMRLLEECVKDVPDLKPPLPSANTDTFFALCENLPGTAVPNAQTEYLIAPTQVGFAAMVTKGSLAGTKEAAQDIVLAHWLSNSVLWERVRTIGGAYGAFAFPDPLASCFRLATYRDPSPEKSLAVLKECLGALPDTEFDAISVEKAIMGCYSREIQPLSPAMRGYNGFLRCLSGITPDMVRERVYTILHATAQELHSAAVVLSGNLGTAREAVLDSKAPEHLAVRVIPLR